MSYKSDLAAAASWKVTLAPIKRWCSLPTPRPQPKVHCSESAAIRGGLMPSGPKRIMPQGSRSSTLHVPDSPDLLQQIWAKFQQVLLGSSQNMHSDIIRAGWLVCGDRGTIKANRERAGPGWSHHTPPSFLESSGETPVQPRVQNKQ